MGWVREYLPFTTKKKKTLQPHKLYTSSTVICPNQSFCTCSFTKKYLISYKWDRAGQAHPKPELGQRFKIQNSTLAPNPLLIGQGWAGSPFKPNPLPSLGKTFLVATVRLQVQVMLFIKKLKHQTISPLQTCSGACMYIPAFN